MQHETEYNTIQHEIQYNTAWNTIQYSMKYNTIQYNTIQHEIQYNTIQCSMKWNTIHKYNIINWIRQSSLCKNVLSSEWKSCLAKSLSSLVYQYLFAKTYICILHIWHSDIIMSAYVSKSDILGPIDYFSDIVLRIWYHLKGLCLQITV